MSVRLSSDDRRYLEKLAGRKMRPTSRQKAQALLRLDSGDPPENVSMRVGITKEELAFLGWGESFSRRTGMTSRDCTARGFPIAASSYEPMTPRPNR